MKKDPAMQALATEIEKTKLTPPDLEQCQAEVPNGVNFMTCGGRFERIRCKNKPTVIAVEMKPGIDGQHGSMSLCDRCHGQFIKQLPEGYATFNFIEQAST